MEQLSSSNIQIIFAVLAGITWLIRLEAKVNYLEKDQKRMNTSFVDTNKDNNVKIDLLFKNLTEIKVSLSRIEGFLSKNVDDTKENI